MQNKSYEQFIITQATIEANKQETKYNKQDYNDKMTKFKEDFKAMSEAITDNINTFKSSTYQKDSSKPQDLTTVVSDNRKATTLDGGQSTKLLSCGI